MCAKKDNYYETLTWLEDTIESSLTINDEKIARENIRVFENTLLNDKSINAYVFGQFMDRLHDKMKNQYNIIIDNFYSNTI
jgi:hypothetical protein